MNWFRSAHKDVLSVPYARRDWEQLHLLWVLYVDSLKREGRITEKQRNNWSVPSFLKKKALA